MITGGKSFVSSPPAFSNDGKKLLVCTGDTVSIYSTSTGMQVTELEGHMDSVTSVVVVPFVGSASKVMCYCWTSSLDGSICYWDFSAPELIKRVEVHLPIFSMVIPNISDSSVESGGNSSNVHAFVSVQDMNKPMRGQILVYNLTKSHRVGKNQILTETRNPEILSVSNSGEFLGVPIKRKLHIWRIPTKKFKYNDIRKIRLHHSKILSALAFHPSERMVAGGDVTGRVLIWRGFGRRTFSDNLPINGGRAENDEERPGVRGNDDADSCSTWHWHPYEVKFLSFSSDGAYLYSGGKEGVLVVWQIDTGKKKFKPRLGSPLLFFRDSPDPSLSCICCADNQIHITKMPSVDIIKSISGIKLPFTLPDTYEGFRGSAFDRSAGLIALRTEDYCIQFFNLFDNVEVSQVQVCERNFQPVDDVTLYVDLIALSMDGSMMGTVDVKLPEENFGGRVILKFWTRGSQIGEYTLSTVIYEPHSDAGISALAFRTGQSMAVTSSFGGEFKVWVHKSLVQHKDQMLDNSGWRCQSVGSYKKKPMTAAAFSADGSVLAVAVETVITLWNPDTNTLVAVIGDALTPITSLSFAGDSQYLLSLSRGTKPQLVVWSLSNLSIYWSYKLSAEAVSCTEDGSHFAILAHVNVSNDNIARDQDGIIVLFNVEDPTPAATWLVKKANGGGLSFLPANPLCNETKATGEKDRSLLAYVNSEHEYIVFDPYISEENFISRKARRAHVPAEETERFGYTSIYGELPEFDLKREDFSEIPYVTLERPWETIFSGSSHALPSLTKLCSTFLASLLEKRPCTAEL